MLEAGTVSKIENRSLRQNSKHHPRNERYVTTASGGFMMFMGSVDQPFCEAIGYSTYYYYTVVPVPGSSTNKHIVVASCDVLHCLC